MPQRLVIYSNPGTFALGEPTQVSARLLAASRGRYGDGSYISLIYRIRFYADTEWYSTGNASDGERTYWNDVSDETPGYYTTVARINVPCDLDGVGPRPRIVLMMPGVFGSSVSFREGGSIDDPLPTDEALGVLASGSQITYPTADGDEPFGREGGPAFTVTFNYPGSGEGSLSATGHPWFSHHPSPHFYDDASGLGDGCDIGGELSMAMAESAMDIASQLVRQIMHPVRRRKTRMRPKVILWTVSSGLIPGSRWAVSTKHDVHGHVDYEGPTDSDDLMLVDYIFERFTPIKGDHPMGTGYANNDPTYEEWAWGSGPEFEMAWSRAFMPPDSVIDQFGRVYEDEGHSAIRLPGVPTSEPYQDWYGWDDGGSSGGSSGGFTRFHPSVLDVMGAIWATRDAKQYLTERRWPYVRIQGYTDHISPSHIHDNYHAYKALQSACRFRDKPHRVDPDYMTTAVYGGDYEREDNEPVEYTLSMLNPNPEHFPDWPDYSDYPLSGGDRGFWKQSASVDVIRWLANQS